MRSILVVPGSDERKIAKALHAGADAVVLDLEDSVVPGQKDDARDIVAAHLSSPSTGPAITVRVNPIQTPWFHRDVVACVLADHPPTEIVLPKVDRASDVALLDGLIECLAAEAGRHVGARICALIETASGLVNLGEIVTASTRLSALVIGYADLAASLGRAAGSPPQQWVAVQDTVLAAGRHAGLRVVDGPAFGLQVDDEFRAAVRHARQMGFDGKWVIHPSQIETVTAEFTPSDAEVAHARAVLRALDDAAREGRGAVALDGRMLDEAIAVAARRTLSRADVATLADLDDPPLDHR